MASVIDKQLLYVQDENKRCPPQFVDEIQEKVKSNIDNAIKKTYIGYLLIPTTSFEYPEYPKNPNNLKYNIILIFLDNNTKLLNITDINGNTLDMGVILYSPYITYHELVQLYKHYKMAYIKLTNMCHDVPIYEFKPETQEKKAEKLCIN